MPERLPTFGESPYYNILVPWLQVSHAADGTIGTINSAVSQAHRIGSGSDFVAPTNNAWTLTVSGVITPGLGQPGYGFISAPNFTKHTSGTHAQFVNAEIDFPHITNPGAGAVVTDLVALRLGADGAPSGATNMYAIKILNGRTLFAGLDADASNPAVGLPNNRMVSWQDSAGGYTNPAYVYCDASNYLSFGNNNAVRMRLTPSGGLLLSATDPGFANVSGRLTQPNNSQHFWVDSAGGSTNAMFIGGDSSNNLNLGTGNTNRVTITQGGQVQLGTDVKFGTNTAKGAEAFDSFITITDAAGNSRKLMVCV